MAIEIRYGCNLWPISVASPKQCNYMRQPNFGHFNCFPKAQHLNGATPFWLPWLPSQGNTHGWGDQISITLVAFPRQHTWIGRPHFYCLSCFHKVMQLDGVTPFWFPWSPLQGDALGWGDPISIASITFARWHIWMGVKQHKTKRPNFDHLLPITMVTWKLETQAWIVVMNFYNQF